MDIAPIREAVQRAIAPLTAATPQSSAAKDFLFTGRRMAARLPEYYLVYFLLVDLLGFKNLGQFEKIAWSVPVDLRGRAFLIEHRKFGIGVFGGDAPTDENDAAEVAELIRRGVKAAEPYFTWRAAEAVRASQLNVVNKAGELFERYRYFADRYKEVRAEAERRKDETIRTDIRPNAWTISRPSVALRRQAKWLALSTIESFFSWTEHVFILLAILQSRCTTGDEVAKLASANWATKYKAGLDLTDVEDKRFYGELIAIRRQLRNFVAHGAFGKDGEAFLFHSNCGTVPVRLPHQEDAASFRFGRGIEFVDHDAIELLEAFVAHLWSGARAPAKLYIQDHGMPLILTMAQSGEYQAAMVSEEAMTAFSDHLGQLMDRYSNMDF
ncbi:MAG: hypothetical protein WDM91_19380 [Rhizomicrobium sp.]